MSAVLKDLPVSGFKVPKGVVFKKIDPKTGLLATRNDKEAIFECFKGGTAPTQYADKAPSRLPTDFFKMDLDTGSQP
jgi:penicillin-binding protein 1A